MNTRRALIVSIRCWVVFLLLTHDVNAEVKEGAARELAENIVRSHLHVGVTDFVNVRREEDLELRLNWLLGPAAAQWLFRVNLTGIELRGTILIKHDSTGGDLDCLVGINREDGKVYRIRGFSDAKSQFQELIASAKLNQFGNSNLAEFLVRLYLDINPEKRLLKPLHALLDLKQSGEIQCHAVAFAKSFTEREQSFNNWWNTVRPLYQDIQFHFQAVQVGDGQIVEWFVLEPSRPEACGGEVRKVQIKVAADGRFDGPVLLPFSKNR